MKRVNERIIIATDIEMIEAGLLKCEPRENEIDIWSLEHNIVWDKEQWTPILQVFTTPLLEDIHDETGMVLVGKSTHKIDDYYGALVAGTFNFYNFLVARGVKIEAL